MGLRSSAMLAPAVQKCGRFVGARVLNGARKSARQANGILLERSIQILEGVHDWRPEGVWRVTTKAEFQPALCPSEGLEVLQLMGSATRCLNKRVELFLDHLPQLPNPC
jgi:hypothetical protein